MYYYYYQQALKPNFYNIINTTLLLEKLTFHQGSDTPKKHCKNCKNCTIFCNVYGKNWKNCKNSTIFYNVYGKNCN